MKMTGKHGQEQRKPNSVSFSTPHKLEGHQKVTNSSPLTRIDHHAVNNKPHRNGPSSGRICLPKRSHLPQEAGIIFDKVKEIVADKSAMNNVDYFAFNRMKVLCRALVIFLRDLELTRATRDSILSLLLFSVEWLKTYTTGKARYVAIINEGYQFFLFSILECLRGYQNRLKKIHRECSRLYETMKVINDEMHRVNKIEKREGHKKRALAERMKKEAKLNLFKTNDFHIIDEEIQSLYEAMRPLSADEKLRDGVQHELEVEIKALFPSCTLERYGSAANGLGSRGNSDIDLALTNYDLKMLTESDDLEKNETAAKESTHAFPSVTENDLRVETLIVRKIAKLLENTEKFKVTELIDSAKVPIVKAEHVSTGIPCDISAGNNLAVYNTKLLHAYAQYDPRFKPLVFQVKSWAKNRQIADASQGTISSYAWVIMVIFFLQQRKHNQLYGFKACAKDADEKIDYSNVLPVLPCLQTQGRKGRRKSVKTKYNGEEEVEFDVFFRQDLDRVREEIRLSEIGCQADDSSVGELFARFLFFYGYVINMESFLISIRLGKLVNKHKDNHPFRRNIGLSIEDPFELEHDLGTCIRGKTGNVFIVEELRRALPILFKDGSKIGTIESLNGKRELPEALQRHCFTCYELGHESRECPVKKVCNFSGCAYCGNPDHRIRSCDMKSQTERPARFKSKGNREKTPKLPERKKEDFHQSKVNAGNKNTGTSDKARKHHKKSNETHRTSVQSKHSRRPSSKNKGIMTTRDATTSRLEHETKICRQFVMGKCSYGNKCLYLH